MRRCSRSETLCSAAVRRRLADWPPVSRYLLACSGGVDSQLLLYLLADLNLPALHVVHVDHGLHADSARWAAFCHHHCQTLGLGFTLRRVLSSPPTSNIESWARRERHALLGELLRPGDMLLTAHHADDQAETVLAQLLRGAGPRGLAAMPALRPFAAGWHGRPLLDFRRQQIRALAEEQGIGFLEDPGNADRRFDRNYLRHETLPVLRQRWPGLLASLTRVAHHQGALVEVLDELATSDLERVALAERSAMDIDRLLTLSAARQTNVLRHWLAEQSLPPPRAAHIEQILGGLVHAREATGPCVRWPGAELRRYRRRLYALCPLPEHDPAQRLDWDPAQPIELPLGRLSLAPAGGCEAAGVETLAAPKDASVERVSRHTGMAEAGRVPAGSCEDTSVETLTPAADCRDVGVETLTIRAVGHEHWQLRFRRGGERIHLAGAAHHRSLKKLFQERGILPWYRNRIPLLYIEGHLCAVPGLGISAELSPTPGQPSWQLCWQHPLPWLS